MKYLRVEMPDYSIWQVPAHVIAKNYAEYYTSQDPDYTYQEHYEACLQSELIDWAENNMNWDDVKEFASKVEEPEEVDWQQDGWTNGEKEIVDLD